MKQKTMLAPLLFALFTSLSGCQSEAEIKRQKYITEGIKLYGIYCANCHQTKGQGLANLYPPIAGSDYLANKNAVICSIKYGLNGPIVVNGKPYNRAMPAQRQFSDLEVAEITTYIYNQWGDEARTTTAKEVGPILERCSAITPR
jgi:mono/diheme cytochrome c family protein